MFGYGCFYEIYKYYRLFAKTLQIVFQPGDAYIAAVFEYFDNEKTRNGNNREI